MASEQPDPARILSPAQIAELCARLRRRACLRLDCLDPRCTDLQDAANTLAALRQQVETLRQERDDFRQRLSAANAKLTQREAEAIERFNRAEQAEAVTRNLARTLTKTEQQLAALSAAQEQMTWQPIASAPKGEASVLGWFPYYASALEGGGVYVMRWNDDKYALKPRPFWEASGWVWGVRDNRAKQPSHWMPLPALSSSAGSPSATKETTTPMRDGADVPASPDPATASTNEKA